LTRKTQPNDSSQQPTFAFKARWWIDARGGPSLDGSLDLNAAVNPVPFKIGVLLFSPPAAGTGAYTLEHLAAGGLPAGLPEFRQVRIRGATLAQQPNLGGTRLAAQAVILTPGAPVPDAQLACGQPPEQFSCLDLRGDNDTLTSPNRTYRMPDVIIQ